jgi:hypothetical protein
MRKRDARYRSAAVMRDTDLKAMMRAMCDAESVMRDTDLKA